MRHPRRRTVVIAAAVVAVLGLAVGLPLFQPWRLVTDTVVDESLPGSTPVATATPSPSMHPASTTPPTVSSPATSPPTAPPTVTPTPAPTQRTLAGGRFVSHEHGTSGTASVIRLADGSRVLRLEGLDTSDGPDLKVWLTDSAVIAGRAGWHVFDDGRYLSLGDLKGNKGNQNYAIPADLDLGVYRSVAIWCDRFNVSFGAAKLTATPA